MFRALRRHCTTLKPESVTATGTKTKQGPQQGWKDLIFTGTPASTWVEAWIISQILTIPEERSSVKKRGCAPTFLYESRRSWSKRLGDSLKVFLEPF